LFLQCGKNKAGCILNLILTFYHKKLAAGFIVILERLGLFVINVKSVKNGCGFVVLTDGECSAAKVANAVCLWFFILGMIAGAARSANASA
jgi:hypothetical protein